MCVTGHALLSALVRRLKEGGKPATEAELLALLRTGCREEDLARAFCGDLPGLASARLLLERVRALRG